MIPIMPIKANEPKDSKPKTWQEVVVVLGVMLALLLLELYIEGNV